MSRKNTSDLSGWVNLRRILNELNSSTIETGFFPEDSYGSDNDNLPVAQVAVWQEMGTVDIPPRAFIRWGWRTKIAGRSFQRKGANTIKRILSKKESVVSGLKSLGTESTELMKQEIIGWDYPPNSPATIAKKGFDDPLIETGEMLNSVKSKVTRITGDK